MGKPTSRGQYSEVSSQKVLIADLRLLTSDTRYWTSEYIGGSKQTRGTETSQYPEERTSTETPLVVASERGPGQWRMRDNRNRLESRALAGDSPVRVMRAFVLE